MKKVMFLVLCAVIVAGVGLSYGCKKKTAVEQATEAVDDSAKDASKALDEVTK